MIKGYIDGVNTYTKSSLNLSFSVTKPLYIGRYDGSAAPSWLYSGDLSEFRVSDVARYSGDFVPQINPFVSDSNTKVLLHFTGSGQTFIDSSPSANTITPSGNATQIVENSVGANAFPIVPSGVTVTNNGTWTKDDLGNNKSVLRFNGSTNYVSLSFN